MDRHAFQQAWGQMMARAWTDISFKARLLDAPEVVLKEYGCAVPPQLLIKVVENADRMIHLRCTRQGAPQWYLECTSSCYRRPEPGSLVQVWSRWRAGWTEGVAIPPEAGCNA
jgi:hypothetical protein